ncbi:MAG: RNA polymerase sigma factor [Gaiellaceae bacterium]
MPRGGANGLAHSGDAGPRDLFHDAVMGAAPQLAEDLFNEHSRRIYAYCLRQLGSPEEAEDAVQATYLNACRSLLTGFEPDVAQAWLFKVAQNVCLSRQRSSSRRARVERPHDLQAVQDVVAAPESQDDELFGLGDALAGLPTQQRRAILLREWQGLSYREVAEEMEITQSAVETLIFRARRSLASALEQPAARPARRGLLHSLDAGALLASLKTALAGNLSASVAAGVAVAASATTIAATPAAQALELRPAPAPLAKVAAPRPAERPAHVHLADHSAPATRAGGGRDPRGWAGSNPRAGGKQPGAKPVKLAKPENAATQAHGLAKPPGTRAVPSAPAKSQRKVVAEPPASGQAKKD